MGIYIYIYGDIYIYMYPLYFVGGGPTPPFLWVKNFPPGASGGAMGVEGCDQGEGRSLAVWCTRSRRKR